MSELVNTSMDAKAHFTLFVQLENAHTVLQRVLMAFSRRRVQIQGLQMFDLDQSRPAELQLDFESDAQTVRDLISRLDRIVEVEKVWCETASGAAVQTLRVA